MRKVAGVELTLLDCIRYLHKASGINGIAQIVQDIGPKGQPTQTRASCRCLRELIRSSAGILARLRGPRPAIEVAGAVRQESQGRCSAGSCRQASRRAPQGTCHKKDTKWKLEINESVDIDS